MRPRLADCSALACRRLGFAALLLALSPFCASRSAYAIDHATVPSDAQIIEVYEPNALGYTKFSDDVSFIDFTVSLKYRLFKETFRKLLDSDRERLYLTFTGRSGFYVRTRYSGPVVAKNYNPKLLFRFIPDTGDQKYSRTTAKGPIREFTDYIDFAYAHDSNGQTIDSSAAYQFAVRTAERPDFALDRISRGWDYVQVAAKHTVNFSATESNRIAIFADLKFFLRHGFLQGVPEEYNIWENDPTGRPRHAYDGVSLTAEYRPFVTQLAPNHLPLFSNPRLSVQYKTGYAPIARHNTIRAEFGIQVIELPIAIWAQDGYDSSLARYYKKDHGVGIELRFAE